MAYRSCVVVYVEAPFHLHGGEIPMRGDERCELLHPHLHVRVFHVRQDLDAVAGGKIQHLIDLRNLLQFFEGFPFLPARQRQALPDADGSAFVINSQKDDTHMIRTLHRSEPVHRYKKDVHADKRKKKSGKGDNRHEGGLPSLPPNGDPLVNHDSI